MKKKRKYPIDFRTMYFQIKVKDIERAKKFYEEIFNFEVSWYMSPEAGWCEFYLPDGVSRLGLNLVAQDEDITNSGILTFDVKNIEKAKSYLEGKGIQTTEIIDVPKMVSYFNMKDSEGNTLQIVSDPRITN